MLLSYTLSLHLLAASPVAGTEFIPNERQYLPVLRGEIIRNWPDVTPKAAFAAQVRQETCAGLKGKKCWSPYAELKTAREYGFGLGQITITSKFDNFKEARKLDPSMKDWTWGDRYNAQFQLRTMVLMDKFNYGKFGWAANNRERMSFSVAAYNGGIGGVLSDRAICRTVKGCDPSKWFGHVELYSKKGKKAATGYGQGFFYINRLYVRNIMGQYQDRYKAYFGEI